MAISSSSSTQLVNLGHGHSHFVDNQLPMGAMNPAALALLPYIPGPNVPCAAPPCTVNNYHAHHWRRSFLGSP